MKKEQTAHAVRRWIQRPGAQVWTAFWSTLVFGLFCHGMGLLNKLSHQDDIANLFGFGATITSGRWMLHVLSWLEGLFFGTGNASLPLYNGAISILCVGASCALLVDLLRIRNRVYCALMGSLMVAFPVMAVLFSYMFTSHPYMIGLLMMTLCGWLICKETPWWLKVVGVVLGSASVGVYQAFLPMLPTIFLIDDLMKLKRGKEIGKILRSIGVQALCAAGVLLVYFAVNRLFLHKFGLELSSYQGIDQMESMSVRTLLERTGKAYRLFFFPGENPGADMYPGTLRGMYYLMLAVNGLQCDGGRVEYVALRLVVNSHDAVAVSCGKTYGFRTIAAVHSDTIIIVLEAYDLFAWYWVTTRTSAVLRTRFPVKVHVYVL